MLTTALNLCQGNRRHCALQATELSAGAQHIAASTAAEIDVHMAFAKLVLKHVNRGVRRASIGTAREGVEGNEVHLAAETAEQFDQSGGILGMVVHIREEDILKGEPIALCQWIRPT